MSDRKRGRPRKIVTTTSPIDENATDKPIEPFAHDQLKDALFYIEDMLERSMIPFMVLGSTAKQIVGSPDALLTDTKITLGVLRSALTEAGSSMLRGIVPSLKWYPDKLTYTHSNDVPVIIHILEKADYFERPDSMFWMVTELKFPNPFLKYWEERGLND